MKLILSNIRTSIEGKEILYGVSLTITAGQVHAVMGPNGSGKSTLAYALMAHPHYEVKGKIFFNGKNISAEKTQERAKRGIFLALQSPIAIPGVSVTNLLRTAYQEIHSNKKTEGNIQNPILARRWKGADMTLSEFTEKLKEYAKMLHVDETFLSRGIHDGFSGGEKKKIEMLQALMLHPNVALFDEIDTGLDVDALKTVSHGIEALKQKGTGILIITHYQRILKYLKPDFVHVLIAGKIVKSGNASLAQKIEKEGYNEYQSI